MVEIHLIANWWVDGDLDLSEYVVYCRGYSIFVLGTVTFGP